MKHFKNLITLFVFVSGFTFASHAQSDMEKLSSTKPASLTTPASSTAANVKKEAEKYFNISMLDAFRSNTNQALTQWKQAARGNGEPLHDAYTKEKQLYLNELNKALSSNQSKDVIQKAHAEIKRLSEIK